MPAERFAAALNEQVGREFAAAHQYVSIGTHYEDQTFPRLAHFFYEQAEEERGHAMKMVKYMLDTNCPVELGPIAAPTNHFESHIEPIKAALEQERKVTVHISGCLRSRAKRRTTRASSSSSGSWTSRSRRKPRCKTCCRSPSAPARSRCCSRSTSRANMATE